MAVSGWSSRSRTAKVSWVGEGTLRLGERLANAMARYCEIWFDPGGYARNPILCICIVRGKYNGPVLADVFFSGKGRLRKPNAIR